MLSFYVCPHPAPADQIAVEANAAILSALSVDIIEAGNAVTHYVFEGFLDAGQAHVKAIGIRIQQIVDAFADFIEVFPAGDVQVV